MMRVKSLIVSLALMMSPALAQADHNPVVLELFTSQGCAACPPADALLSELSKRDDVIALSLHVDYWDYIGWKDQFANPDYTNRQRGYAQAANKRTVYTPQMVIGGVDHVVGTHPREVSAAVAKHAAIDSGIDVAVSRDGDRLTIDLTSEDELSTPMFVHVVRYNESATVDIRRGENAGRTLDYANIVTDLTTIGKWTNRTSRTMRTNVKGDQPVVVLVQRAGFGKIEAAARLN